MNEKEILGIVSVAFSLIGHSAYFWSVFKRRTKAHAFSWIIWSLIAGIGFFAQTSKEAGAGAWATGCTSIVSVIIAILSLFWGEKDIRKSDIIAFLGGLSAIPLWYFTKDPLSAVIVIIIVEVFAFYPTFRKSYFKPREELAFAYSMDVAIYVLSLFAMQHYSLTAVLYPLFVIVTNGSFVLILLWRRAALARLTK